MKSTRTNDAARCPACQKELSAAADIDIHASRGPKGGDISVCAYCALPCQFNDDLTVRALRPDEFMSLPDDLRRLVESYQSMVAAVTRQQGKKS